MPFESKAQNAWAHTPEGTEALGGAAKVKEWEGATDYSHLPQKKAEGGPVVNKGHQAAVGHFAKGGAVQDRSSMKDFNKTDDGRYKKGDWKDSRDVSKGDVEPQNTRVADHDYDDDKGGNQRLGDFLGGGDRFTSQNFAEQGDPASMQRTKPDEDWSKDHVKPSKVQKEVREGDNKSEPPRMPRKKGASILGR